MTDESVKVEDEVKLILYDKDGKVKQTFTSQKRSSSKLERFMRFLEKVLEKW